VGKAHESGQSTCVTQSGGSMNDCTSCLDGMWAASQRASVSYAVQQVGKELQSPVDGTHCATAFYDIRHWPPAKHFPATVPPW